VTRAVNPLEYVHWAVLETGTVADTQVEIDSDVSSPDSELLWGVHWAPHIHTALFTDPLAVLFKSRINRHTVV
jgi:hypothetical protein